MDTATQRSRSDRLLGLVTLTDLPATAALGIIAVLIAASWGAAISLGGGTVVAPHWFYLPIFLAGLRFGPGGALVAAVVSMFVAGPLLPADAATNTPQGLSDWVSRGIFFILIGLFVTEMFRAVRRLSEREAKLIEVQRVETDELTRRAQTDPLTGLANRVLLRDRLESALVRRDRDQHRPALLFIDIDDFKAVNDRFGHDTGDGLLVEVSDRLRHCVRPEDLVARLGGDEFAVLIEEHAPHKDGASDVARRIIEALQSPFDLSGHASNVRVSIGIASYHGGPSAADLILKQADSAMYRAKANGKDQFAIFSQEMDEARHVAGSPPPAVVPDGIASPAPAPVP
jgi:diguanylate cyclase (GGDEF)-like protein